MHHLPSTRRVRVWDLPTRLFHWTLVGLIGFLWLSAELGGAWTERHMMAGYALLTLILFRLAWGLVGSRTARFASFVRGPAAALAYLRSLRAPEPHPVIGHNPLGGWMILLLLALLAVQGVTGLFATDDILVEGPLTHLVNSSTAATLTTIHRLTFKLLLAAAGLHILAALGYLVVKHENLIRPMITGHRDLPTWVPAPDEGFASLWKAALVLAAAAAGMAAVVLGLGA